MVEYQAGKTRQSRLLLHHGEEQYIAILRLQRQGLQMFGEGSLGWLMDPQEQTSF